MAHGIWFGDKTKYEAGMKRFGILVDQTINELAPHFGIKSEEDWDRLAFPKVDIGRRPYYDPMYNIIYLPFDINKSERGVGHETTHWFHGQINEEIFPKEKLPYTDFPVEFVALWGEAILDTGEASWKEVPITQEISLERLVDMSREEISKQFPTLEKEFFYLFQMIIRRRYNLENEK